MNWLAHLYLSGNDPAMQIGNLLPDLLGPAELRGTGPAYRAGIERHYQIDSFTDAHPLFRRSTRRVGGELRRYGTIIVDVFYDHILSREWDRFSDTPREAFIQEFYRNLDRHLPHLPPLAADRLTRLREENWLGSYHDTGGVALTLRRISGRLRRPVALQEAVPALETDYPDFAADFDGFFPELRLHLAGRNHVQALADLEPFR